jgi:hypothetical protein
MHFRNAHPKTHFQNCTSKTALHCHIRDNETRAIALALSGRSRSPQRRDKRTEKNKRT